MDTFLARWFLQYLRGSGILFDGSPNNRKSRNIIQDTIQIVSAVSASLLIMAVLADYWVFNLQDLGSLDFFVIVSFVNRSTYGCQSVLMFLIFFIQRHRIRKLLAEISNVARQVVSAEETRKWSLAGFSFVVCWLLLCHGSHLFVNYTVGDYVVNKRNDGSDSFTVFGVDERYTMPKWMYWTFTVVSQFLTLNTDLAGQMFYFIAISIMTRVMVKINHILSYQCLVESKVTVEVIDALMSVIQQMQRLYRRFNRIFGYIIFLNCVRDLMAMVALMSLLLPTNGPQRPGENSEVYNARLKSREIGKRVYLCQTVISLVNALVRSFLCVRSQKQVLNEC